MTQQLDWKAEREAIKRRWCPRAADGIGVADGEIDVSRLLAHAEEDERKINEVIDTAANFCEELERLNNRNSELEAVADNLRNSETRLESELARTKEAISRSELGEVWIWSTGDPEDGDNADTITCPILIQSEAFRLILAELAAAREANEEVINPSSVTTNILFSFKQLGRFFLCGPCRGRGDRHVDKATYSGQSTCPDCGGTGLAQATEMHNIILAALKAAKNSKIETQGRH